MIYSYLLTTIAFCLQNCGAMFHHDFENKDKHTIIGRDDVAQFWCFTHLQFCGSLVFFGMPGLECKCWCNHQTSCVNWAVVIANWVQLLRLGPRMINSQLQPDRSTISHSKLLSCGLKLRNRHLTIHNKPTTGSEVNDIHPIIKISICQPTDINLNRDIKQPQSQPPTSSAAIPCFASCMSSSRR